MAKFAVELKAEGIKTLSLSPGWVETDAGKFIAQLFRCKATNDLENHSQEPGGESRSVPIRVELLPEAQTQRHRHDLDQGIGT